MSETANETKAASKFVMVYPNDKNGFEERDLDAETKEDAKAQFMGVVRVLDIKTGYVMQRENELIVHSFP